MTVCRVLCEALAVPRAASFNPLQMRKLSLRDVKSLDQSHKAGKWMRQDLNPGLLRRVFLGWAPQWV